MSKGGLSNSYLHDCVFNLLIKRETQKSIGCINIITEVEKGNIRAWEHNHEDQSWLCSSIKNSENPVDKDCCGP